MSGRWLMLVVALFLVTGFGCGKVERATEGNGDGAGKESSDSSVESEYWGDTRIVYAEGVEWKDGLDVPAGQQWATPPADQQYLKLTYHGQMLTRLGTFGPGNEPVLGMMVELTNEYCYGENGLGIDRELVRSVQSDWRYDAHGEMVGQTWRSDDGKMLVRHRFRYDDAGRLVEKVLEDAEGVTERQTYGYDEEGREVELVYLAPDGTVRSKTTSTYSMRGKHRDRKMEVYENGELVAVGTYSDHWDAVVEEWFTISQEWEEVE
jgi:hypothetical protein